VGLSVDRAVGWLLTRWIDHPGNEFLDACRHYGCLSNTMNISFGLAFLAGLASFLSPCVFSLVPVYISYLGGRKASQVNKDANGSGRFESVIHGLAFIVGFSVVFVLLGMAAGAIGSLLSPIRYWLTRIGGIVVIIFGLNMTGLIRIPFLQYDLRHHTTLQKTTGLLPSFLMGVFFSAGWTPCVGPTLGAILTMAMSGGSLLTGGLLLSVYSLGLGIPFLAAALAIDWISRFFKKYGKYLHFVEIAMGVVVVLIGIMLFLGTFNGLARFGLFFDFGI
jgi:cytochrome c-type biogenesis protein